jgi:hypothetical protein
VRYVKCVKSRIDAAGSRFLYDRDNVYVHPTQTCHGLFVPKDEKKMMFTFLRESYTINKTLETLLDKYKTDVV